MSTNPNPQLDPSEIGSNLITAAENAVVKVLTSGDWLSVAYNDRLKLPSDFIDSVWAKVDKEKIVEEMAHQIEEQLASKIVNSMASEIATDIKQVLSVKERREAIRSVVRDNMTKIMG